MKSIRPSLKPLWWLYIAASVVLFYAGMALSAQDLTVLAILSTLFTALCIIANFGYVRQVAYGSSALWLLALILSVASTVGSVLWAVAQGQVPLSELASLPFAVPMLFVLPSWWACYCYALRSPHLWSAEPRVQT